MARQRKSATPKARKPRRERVRAPQELGPDPGDRSWLLRLGTMQDAARILNQAKDRPYWMSIPWDKGPPPPADFFPNEWFQTPTRVYYGFLVRWCRDRFYEKHIDTASKETLHTVSLARKRRLT